MLRVPIYLGNIMHPLKGKKQTKAHIEKRMASMQKRAELTGVWPHGGPPKHTEESLWANVRKGTRNECWPWMGSLNHGYGRVELSGKSYYAHRVIFNLANPGVINISAPKKCADSGWLMHKCDNPPCCNPAHLVVSTHRENHEDKAAKGRGPDFGADRGPRCKLTMEQAREIRALIRTRRETGIGMTNAQYADAYGVSASTISAVVAGRHYKDVA